MRTLLLFDVDGTLITTSGKAFQALKEAFVQVVGRPAPVNGFSPAGKTDPQIFLELLQKAAIEAFEDLLPALLEKYLQLLPTCLKSEHIRTFPGVRKLLRLLAQDDQVALGLLTGNLRAGAQFKLGLAKLWSYFPVGAFGSDNPDRNQLLPYAVRRAEECFQQRFPYSEVVVVGDTKADIRCAHSWGAKAIAVAGPTTSAKVLAQENPDGVVFSLLSELFLPVFCAIRERRLGS